MPKLFAAIDGAGAIRFAREVQRGAACGCHCPECSSPVVAKQGDVRTWHFAHEGGQERPECEVGASNLLRRLAAELLRREGVVVPQYREQIGGRVITLESGLSTGWEWNASPGRRDWVARSQLVDGSDIELYVEVAQPEATPDRADSARLSFVLVLPPLDELQSRTATEHYIRTAGSTLWRRHPDPAGVLDAARAEYREQAATEARQERIRRDAEAATRVQAAAQRDAEVAAARQAEEEVRRAEHAAAQSRQTAAAASFLACTPRRATRSSLIFYELRNGTSWLFYSLEDGGGALLQWPKGQAKELKLPPDVGEMDLDLGVYRTTSLKATLFLNPQAKAVRTDSDPAGIVKWIAGDLQAVPKMDA